MLMIFLYLVPQIKTQLQHLQVAKDLLPSTASIVRTTSVSRNTAGRHSPRLSGKVSKAVLRSLSAKE